MEKTAENKMGVMPIKKLIFSMSLPMMASMLVQALYNIVDSIFVSKISEHALTAVSLAFPMQMLMLAVSLGTGVGVNALLSRSLGEKKYEDANRAANNGLFLVGISSVIFLILGFVIVKPFFQTQVDPNLKNASILIKYGTDYLTLCMVLSFGFSFETMLERILQSTGRTFYSMITQTTGAIVNIILDPILIFGLCGAPKLGIKGAAIATVFGQMVAMLLALYFNIKKNPDVKFSLKLMKPKAKIVRTIYWVGVPSIIMQAIGSVMTYGMNKILAPFSTTAVAVFGVYFKLNSFIFMPVFGLNGGMIPIVSYNYGARKKERIMEAIKFCTVIAVCLMIVGLCIFFAIPDKLLLMFNASDEMIRIGVKALKIIALHFPIAGVSIILISTFQSFGEGFLSLAVSVTRQLIGILPAAYILSKVAGLDYVWFSFPIAEVISLALSIIFFVSLYKRKIKNLS